MSGMQKLWLYSVSYLRWERKDIRVILDIFPLDGYIEIGVLMDLSQVVVQRVVHIRKRNRISQKSLAAAIGITQTQYSNIENGRSSLSLRQLEKVAAAFGVEPWEILHPDWQTLCLSVHFPT
jgi:DNA-binding XRE family transcriptional regulator